jgi:predicted permease
MRRLGRAPLFTTVAVLTLGLGIGANTAIFGVVYGVLIKPLPFADADALIAVWHSAAGLNLAELKQSPATYLTYRDDNRVFEDLALWEDGAVSVTGVGDPERVATLTVTDGFLPLLRIRPQMGRVFDREDDSPRTPERVILAHGYWQRKFGGDPQVIGRHITIEGRPREIIGVLPQGFRFLSTNFQMLLPVRLNRAEVVFGNFNWRAIARLRPGVTIDQAHADVARMLPLVAERFPLPGGFTRQMFDEARMAPVLHPLADDVVGEVRRVLWVLLGTVTIVLLIACANVANLFLVRAEGRQQELAIHSALGAGRRRLAWELLSESLALAAIGGLAGVVLATIGIQILPAIAPEGLPRIDEIAIDAPVLIFAAFVSVLSGLFFGAIPIVRFASPNIGGALKEGGRLSSASRERHRARNMLVVGQIALAVVLLVASGLMIRTFQAMRNVQPGFVDPEQVLTVRVAIPQSVVRDPMQTVRLHDQIAERIAQVPGVRSVGLSSNITMDGFASNDPVWVEDFPAPEGRIPPIRRYKSLGRGYFETMGNPLVAGRMFTPEELLGQGHAVLISENFAREYWKEPAAALGKRVRENPKSPWRTIVGVTGNERDNGLAHAAPTTIYWPFVVRDFHGDPIAIRRNMGYAIRSDRAASPTLLKEVQQAVWAVNPNLPLAMVRTLDRIRADSMAQTSFALVTLGISAGVALLLGVVGIYGVLAYIVVQRTREIGIRLALGAGQRDVRTLFLRHGVMLTITGLMLGFAAAAGVTRVMSALLYGVSTVDPTTYVTVAVGLGAATLLASYLPAARAARVDPAVALRREG